MSDAPKFKTFRDLKTIPPAKNEKPKLELINPDLTQTSGRPGVDQTQTKPLPGIDQSQTNPRPKTDSSQTNSKKSTTPEKDFNKRANVLEREALPQGMFPGASKKIYDAFYLRTIGSISGLPTIQATRAEIMKWSGVRNIKTVNTHLKKLREAGLIGWTNIIGEHEGSLYEVYLPDQIQPRPNPDPTQTKDGPIPDQKLGLDQAQKMVWVGLGNPIENKDTYANAKTSLKTIKNIDDEAFAEFVEVFAKFAEKICGRKPSLEESEKWKELAEVIVTELEIAAARTNVSSVPAFAAEHLRRRLLGKSRHGKKPQDKAARVGETPPHIRESFDEKGNLLVKSLSEEGRSENLKTLEEMIAEGFSIDNMQKYFTADDWTWLKKELEKK